MKPRASIYVDAQNLYYSARIAGAQRGLRRAMPDYERIATEAIQAAAGVIGTDWREVEVARQRIYTTSRKRTLGFENALEHMGYTVQSHILRSEQDSFDWDVAIACDVMADCAQSSDGELVVVLVTGDGDFVHLTRKLGSLGVKSVVLGYEGMTSSLFENTVLLSEETIYAR